MSYGYSPAPLPPPLIAQRSWFSRNWKWFIPTVILGPILLIALFIGAVVGMVFGMIKSSDPYQHAVAVASHDSHVTGQLGTPITPGWYVTGNINTSGSSGNAELSIPLNGPTRHGTVYVVAKKSAGNWRYQTLAVEIEGEPERVNLLPAVTPEPAEEK